jgi:hypothetical protein
VNIGDLLIITLQVDLAFPKMPIFDSKKNYTKISRLMFWKTVILCGEQNTVFV